MRNKCYDFDHTLTHAGVINSCPHLSSRAKSRDLLLRNKCYDFDHTLTHAGVINSCPLLSSRAKSRDLLLRNKCYDFDPLTQRSQGLRATNATTLTTHSPTPV